MDARPDSFLPVDSSPLGLVQVPVRADIDRGDIVPAGTGLVGTGPADIDPEDIDRDIGLAPH